MKNLFLATVAASMVAALGAVAAAQSQNGGLSLETQRIIRERLVGVPNAIGETRRDFLRTQEVQDAIERARKAGKDQVQISKETQNVIREGLARLSHALGATRRDFLRAQEEREHLEEAREAGQERLKQEARQLISERMVKIPLIGTSGGVTDYYLRIHEEWKAGKDGGGGGKPAAERCAIAAAGNVAEDGRDQTTGADGCADECDDGESDADGCADE